MGIQQFLSRVLESATSDVDLRAYQAGIVPVEVWKKNPQRNQNRGQKRAAATAAAEGQGDDAGATKTSSSSSGAAGKRRPLRIGLDASIWIYQACQRYSTMLGDERHLSNYGRATLHLETMTTTETTLTPQQQHEQIIEEQEEQERIRNYVFACAKFVQDRVLTLQRTTKGEVLVVMDGATPPLKREEVSRRSARRKALEQARDAPVDATTNDVVDIDEGEDEHDRLRRNAFRRAGAGKNFPAVLNQVVNALRESQIPFLVAPYEADGQLAYLSNAGLVDLVVTEDSDLVAYGISPILFKLRDEIGNGIPRGRLYRREYLGAATVSCTGNNKSSFNLMDFTPVMLSVMFVATGCDYCQSLPGIGLVTAYNIVKTAFFEQDDYQRCQRNKRARNSCSNTNDVIPTTVLEIVFAELYDKCYDRNRRHVLTDAFKEAYEHDFMAALLMFRHPVVYDPVRGRCVSVGCPSGADNCRENENSDDDGVGSGGGDPELTAYEPYRTLCRDAAKRYALVGSLIEPPALATRVAEGWVSPKTLQPRDDGTKQQQPPQQQPQKEHDI